MFADPFNRVLPAVACLLLILPGAGCQQSDKANPPASSFNLFAPKASKEEWTIQCLRSEQPGHEQYCQQIAEMLRHVKGLKVDEVQVSTDGTGSNILYGRYTKVASADSEHLVFPKRYQEDMALIQQLMLQNVPVFRYAKPEPLHAARPAPSDQPTADGDYDVARAKGPYTLQIGVFYDTPSFNQHREAAEEYVKLLRQEGFDAYFRHEPVKTFVYVGDFDESDITQTPDGPRFGPRVEQFISRREEEFRHMLENLHIVKHTGPGGQLVIPPSFLVPVPRN